MTNFRIFFNNPYLYVKKNPNSSLRFILIPSSWFFQGQLYTDKTEKAFKILMDILLIILFYSIIINFTNFYIGILISFIIAHSISWFFNTNFLILFTKKFGFSIRGINTSLDINYIKYFQKRIKYEKSISCAIIFGSVSREVNNEMSDLDVRIIRKSGIINGLRVCIFALFERTRANFNKFPLDLFVIDSTKPLSKLRDDESPIVLYDPERRLEKIYSEVIYFRKIVKEEIV
jgi:predicted nucleotidyltransferase